MLSVSIKIIWNTRARSERKQKNYQVKNKERREIGKTQDAYFNKERTNNEKQLGGRKIKNGGYKK